MCELFYVMRGINIIKYKERKRSLVRPFFCNGDNDKLRFSRYALFFGIMNLIKIGRVSTALNNRSSIEPR